MNFRQLKAFQEVMLTGSVTKAASNIGRTQPAVSSLISGLEKSVGHTLFERRAGRLHPVPEAHFLMEQASGILRNIDNLKQTMKSVSTLESGHLRISCMPVFSDRLMPALISGFVKSRADVTVSLISEKSNEVYNSLASQQFEIGLAEFVPGMPLVESDVAEMECVCAVPSNDPLATKPVITPSDLDGRAMASFVPDHVVRQRVTEIFREQGCHFDVRYEMQNAASQYVFVEEAQACAIMSPMSAREYLFHANGQNRVTFIPFRPVVPFKVAIIRPAHRPLSQLAQAFCETLKREIDDVSKRSI